MFHRFFRPVGAFLAAGLTMALLATMPASAAPEQTSSGLYTDRTFQTFTASNGLSSQYHAYAAGLSQDRPAGLLLQFHGDGAYEFKNPTSSYSLGGSSGIVARARERGFLTVPVLSPDRSGSVTWWESGNQNADYVRDLLAELQGHYSIDPERIWLVGYSGGAQFVTQFFLPKHSATIAGGGAVVFGGGGSPYAVKAQPFASGLVPDFPMHWYTGLDDDGRNGSFDALGNARKGAAWYGERGITTSLETPEGVGHNLSGRFGGIVAQQLDKRDAGTPAPAPAPTAPPADEPTTEPADEPSTEPVPESSAQPTMAPPPVPDPEPAPAPEGDREPKGDPVPAPDTGADPTAPAPADLQYTAVRTERGMVFQGLVPGQRTVTLRASRSPLSGQVGWYLSAAPRAAGDVRIELTKFDAGQPYYWRLEGANGSVLATGRVGGAPTSSPAPAEEGSPDGPAAPQQPPADDTAVLRPWDHTVTPARVGVTVDVYVPARAARTTLRVSASPIRSQTGWYTYTRATGEDVSLRIRRSLSPGTRYYWQLESGSRSNVVASGQFTTRR